MTGAMPLKDVLADIMQDGNERDAPMLRGEARKRGYVTTDRQVSTYLARARESGFLVRIAFGVYRRVGGVGQTIPVYVEPPLPPVKALESVEATPAVAAAVASIMADGGDHTVDDVVVRAKERGVAIAREKVMTALADGLIAGTYVGVAPGRVQLAKPCRKTG